MIEIKNAEYFFKIQKRMKIIPFTQSKGWYNYMLCKNNDIRFFVDNENDVNIAVWGTEQKIPFTKRKILLVNGEVISKTINEKKIRSFYKTFEDFTYVGIEINSNNTYNIDFEIGIRRAGFFRPIGLFNCPLTISFQIQEEFKFDNNWKRNVKKAIIAELKFEEIRIVNNKIILTIISMFKEMADLKKLGYLLDRKSLSSLLESEDMRLFMVYDNKENAVAARIIHDNMPYASDVYAANSLKARDNGATYFIMQNIFETLKEERFTEFDFGRIPPSNHATDSVYVFKNASRGKKVQYNGEWCFYKNKRLELLIFLYKRFKLKKQRY